MSSESLSRPIGRQNGPAKPFQFTLRQIFIWMFCVSILLALAVQLGFLLIPLVWVSVLVGLFVYAASKGSIEAGVCGVLMLGISGCLCLPAVQTGRGASPRSHCSNNLKQISLALQNYHDCLGTFPPAYIPDAQGRPMHSWRVLILPFIEQKALYDKYNFNEPWNGPNNSKLADYMPHVFCCPCDNDRGKTMETSYVAVVGQETAWPAEKAISMADIADGSSNTLMVVEVRDSGIHWMEPRDLHISQMPMTVNAPRGQGLSSEHRPSRNKPAFGAQCAFADGHVQLLPSETPPEALRAALTRAGGEQIELP